MNHDELFDAYVGIDPNNPTDQDRMVEISAMLTGNGQGNYPGIRELVRIYGGKENAYVAALNIWPGMEDNFYALREFMTLAIRAERELTASN